MKERLNHATTKSAHPQVHVYYYYSVLLSLYLVCIPQNYSQIVYYSIAGLTIYFNYLAWGLGIEVTDMVVLHQSITIILSPQPPAGSFPAHVNSSNYHTESSVHLGWSHDWLYPSGTMAASYQPLSQRPHRAKAPSVDNLPLHYFPSHLMNSTTADSYRSVENGGTLNKISPQALNNV